MKIGALVAALFLLVARAQAAEMSEVGPQVSASQLIAAHGAASVPILRVTYQQSEDGKAAVTRRADIAPDFIYAEISSGNLLLDYKLRRRILMDAGSHTFANLSLFMMTDFRYIESFNRRMDRKMLKQVGVPNLPVDLTNPFWSQQTLGVASADDGPAQVTQSAAGGGVKFVADGETAASFTPSANALSADEMAGFVHFLRETAILHPSVVEAISASGHVPDRLSFLHIEAGHKMGFSWKLVSVERVTGAYPLTPDYAPKVPPDEKASGDSAALHGLVPLMLDAIAGRAGKGPRSVESYQAALADALKQGAIFQHFVLDNEFLLQYGQTVGCQPTSGGSCALSSDAIDKWKADGRARAVIDSFAAEDARDLKRAIEMRKAVSREGLSDPYMLDLWIGDAYTQGGHPEIAIPLLANAIRGNPYVAGFYKDLGDAYNREFDPVDSWVCYDLARALPGGSSAPVASEINKLESDLLARYPEFF